MTSENSLNSMGNGLSERGIGVIEVSKVDFQSTIKGFCVANAMKILNINLTKISVCTPRLFILKTVELCR